MLKTGILALLVIVGLAAGVLVRHRQYQAEKRHDAAAVVEITSPPPPAITESPQAPFPNTASSVSEVVTPPPKPEPFRLVFGRSFREVGLRAVEPGIGTPVRVLGYVLPLQRDEGEYYVELPEGTTPPATGSLKWQLGGWRELQCRLSFDSSGKKAALEGVFYLERSTASLHLDMPASGCDYAHVELRWKRALADEPAARPPDAPPVLSLDFKGRKTWLDLPTGIYAMTVRGRDNRFVNDFVLDPELSMISATPERAALAPVRLLPPSISGGYIAYLPSHDPATRENEGLVSFFGISFNFNDGKGEVITAYHRVVHGQLVQFSDLKPRADTWWPAANVSLRDPSRVEFDAPFLFADYHLTLLTADGVPAVKGQFVAAETEKLQDDWYQRMKSLSRKQFQYATNNARLFDPETAGLPYEVFPYFTTLSNRKSFVEHLDSIRSHVHEWMDVGRGIVMEKAAAGYWQARFSENRPSLVNK
jgi:hypothetical protein